MARPPQSKLVDETPEAPRKRDPFIFVRFIIWLVRPFVKFVLIILLITTVIVGIFKWLNPPLTYLMYTEYQRLGVVRYEWRNLEDMSPNIPLAVAAAEDANFCAHNGVDFDAVKTALRDGSGRGASTITQQVAKNVFLWPSRSWLRKGLEAGLTVVIESLWSKRRIMEVYLNVVELDEGIFGVDAAISAHFNSAPENLRLADAARLAVVLPDPRGRAASRLSNPLERHASRISIGATTLRDEGRADCFLPKASP